MTDTKSVISCKKKNECEICNKIIIGSSYKFKAHLFKHRAMKGKKMFICDYCNRFFVVKSSLYRHIKVHDEIYSKKYFIFKCVACGVSFCEERLLKYHIRKEHFNFQENEPAYVEKQVNETWLEPVLETEVCVEMTKVNNNVINIKKSLIELKIKDNPESSRYKEYMSSVMASKDKSQYSMAVCDYCNKAMLKKSLRSHIRERHLKLKKFSCDKCKEAFSRHYLLVNHICGKYKSRPWK